MAGPEARVAFRNPRALRNPRARCASSTEATPRAARREVARPATRRLRPTWVAHHRRREPGQPRPQARRAEKRHRQAERRELGEHERRQRGRRHMAEVGDGPVPLVVAVGGDARVQRVAERQRPALAGSELPLVAPQRLGIEPALLDVRRARSGRPAARRTRSSGSPRRSPAWPGRRHRRRRAARRRRAGTAVAPPGSDRSVGPAPPSR